MESLIRCLVFTLICSLAACQTSSSSVLHPYQSLSPPGPYDDGGFRVPNTSTQGYIFTAGRNMNVTWWTNYRETNLWLIKGDDYASQIKIAAHTSLKWHEWIVDDQGDNSKPFHFRGTDPFGSDTDQTQGGFWTGEFWIRPEPSTSASSVPATSTSKSPKKASSVAGNGKSKDDGSDSSSVGIGAGVGVGAGVAVIATGGLIFWCLRRRKKRKAEQQWPAPSNRPVDGPPPRNAPNKSPTQMGSSTRWSQSARPHYTPMEMRRVQPWQPSELAAPRLRSPVEAPNDMWDPRELPGDNRWKTPGSTGLPGK